MQPPTVDDILQSAIAKLLQTMREETMVICTCECWNRNKVNFVCDRKHITIREDGQCDDFIAIPKEETKDGNN